MAIQGAAGELRRISPHLLVRNAKQTIEFYKKAFSAKVLYSSPLPHSPGMHYHLRIGETMLMVTDEMPQEEENPLEQEVALRSPETLGGTGVVLELIVEDVDAAYQRAVDAGAKPTLEVSDTFWGDRYGWVTDPAGHIWALATIKEMLTPAQVEERIAQMMQTQA